MSCNTCNDTNDGEYTKTCNTYSTSTVKGLIYVLSLRLNHVNSFPERCSNQFNDLNEYIVYCDTIVSFKTKLEKNVTVISDQRLLDIHEPKYRSLKVHLDGVYKQLTKLTLLLKQETRNKQERSG